MLLIHGLGTDHRMWAPQIKRYSDEGFRLIVPDIRGHGKSSSSDYLSMQIWVNDLIDLLELMKLQKVGMAGVSMGGIIAQAFAISHAARLSFLVLADTFCELGSFTERITGGAVLMGLRIGKMLGRNFGQKRLANSLASVSVPSIVVVGSGFGANFVAANRKIAETIPGCEFNVIDDVVVPFMTQAR